MATFEGMDQQAMKAWMDKLKRQKADRANEGSQPDVPDIHSGMAEIYRGREQDLAAPLDATIRRYARMQRRQSVRLRTRLSHGIGNCGASPTVMSAAMAS
ncbi:MAG: hypothetical protein CMI61_11405 [Parvibaculum sp.]|nr:hypothetical protein [Parvibaculum sp.]HCX69150.1 hypothetical protein [Rhodobiaceae bacterium]